jgi:hypothetical protein
MSKTPRDDCGIVKVAGRVTWKTTIKGDEMASVRRETSIDTRVEDAWDALRDFDVVHERVAPGFVTDCRPDGRGRMVTFFDGVTVRELPVTIDDDRRRLVYAIPPGELGMEHYNASVKVAAEQGGGTRFTWTVDLLPDELAERIGERMDLGMAAIKRAWEGSKALAP